MMFTYYVDSILHSHHQQTFIAHLKGQGDDAIIMNIGKKSKLSTQSMRPHFEVGRGPNGDEEYEIVAGK